MPFSSQLQETLFPQMFFHASLKKIKGGVGGEVSVKITCASSQEKSSQGQGVCVGPVLEAAASLK